MTGEKVYCVRKDDYTIGVFSSPINAWELGVLPLVEDYDLEFYQGEETQKDYVLGEVENNPDAVEVGFVDTDLTIDILEETIDCCQYC